ncbi:MAG: hypothetical protein OZ913_10160 [Ignavibacteriaceae bacterium]|jgi:hypothetical protein|nr:MAG: hypothetical protein EDM69_09950 [Chlorobiota bacterium]KXK04123.1 MAG: hypothetical protein UZ04_CHB001001161 [Chlorobi bacterium OLB4]MBV6397892.1 hypothetical protein [Ignavibacteria bacterium]MCC6886839.1 hypothetical protein [Ignavibacteriales bacterium]MCE7953963.1 hypothetical protein [Chlorobi bacterium CHB7]MEB2330645.1 hypothetical protein [Ignavibacteriaceae bacterium]OQY76741.1 MAG: hypothetical protein B6D43_08925 [Ignavibacteriales bacterium UTCHB1]RIK47697.1 MAG: hypot
MIPSEIQTSKTFFLISGIFNILVFLGLVGTTIATGLVTCGFGCLLGVVPVINIISAVMDFIAYNKLNNLNSPGTQNSCQLAAIFDIVSIFTGNIVSLILGIITLNNINSEAFSSFLREKNIY